MTAPTDDAALAIARRIADGEAVDLSALQLEDPALARRLAKLQALVRSMHGDTDAGSSWGHLQQLQPAGQGGFGAVYRAYDPTLDRTVALKLRHEQSDALLPSGRDFVAEARRLARVRHPNVLAVHGASYHDGRAGLWADWIDGETLSARLQRSGPLQGDELLRVLIELADAIDAVHRAGLVHGDITASNVMLDAQGRVILMDFGAGFESSDEGSAISAGTPRYLAPEIAAGKPGTQAVDLYAYGVLAHLLTTNRYPDGARANASLRPRGLRDLIGNTLHADPASRPTAQQLRHRLQRLVDAPRRRVRRALLVSVALGLLGITLATVVGLRREQAQRHLAETARDEAGATAAFLTELLAAPAPESRGRDVRVVELLDTAVLRARSETDLSHATRAGLLLTIGRSQLALNRFRDADATLTQALSLDRPEQPLAPAQALQVGLHLAEVRARRQHFAEADAVLARISADPRWQGDAQANASIAVQRAGWWYQQGKLEDAETALAKVLESRSSLPVTTQLDALVTRGQILFEQRKLAKTEASTREALALLKSSGERFGIREFELRLMLGNVTTMQGRDRDGEAIYRALAIDVGRTFGEGSMSAAGVWANVAVALNSQERFAEAATLLREWIPKVEALEGKQNARMVLLRSNLAVALQHEGRRGEALAELDAVIAMSASVYGAHHSQTLIARFNRVEALNDSGQSQQAFDEGQALRTDMIAAVGEGHPFTLETEDAIGFALTRLDRAAQAEAMHRRTIAGKTAALGADNPYTLLSREYLGRALIALRRFDDARTELATLVADRERVLGRDKHRTAVARDLLDSLPP